MSSLDVDGPGTLSHEQVRKILHGKAIPRWQILETLVRALVSVCGVYPRHPEIEVDRFRALWRAANTGTYGLSELILHPGAPECTRGDGAQWVPDDITRLMINPIYAIEIDPSLALPHEPLISDEEWIAVNLRILAEIGPETFLRTLLDTLRGNYIAGSDDADDEETHCGIDADLADEFVAQQVLQRLRSEPAILARSINALRGAPETAVDPSLRDEIDFLEQQQNVVQQVLGVSDQTWRNISDHAQKLVLLYLVDHIVVGAPGQPIDSLLTIVWRVPKPGDTAE
ncbi:hypothetical protein [Nocardia sp. NPDC050793]|uniref:hypothetical protein n=1 Tax=Nocardia sp. NPDC050793 TaxID=3155159 RepID=UPI0033C5F04F